MKKSIMGVVVSCLFLTLSSFRFSGGLPAEGPSEGITWLTFEQAVELNKKQPKKMFFDIYTDWCTWCKRMDASTFKDPEVVKWMNQHFYAVKFNAEQKADVAYKGHTLKFQAAGGRGYHELAFSLLDGRLGYPSFVYLDENENRITISPGYKNADTLLKELRYVSGNHYQTLSFEEFLKKGDL